MERGGGQKSDCQHNTIFILHVVNEAIQATAPGASNQDRVR
jgi:hypothetical protein